MSDEKRYLYRGVRPHQLRQIEALLASRFEGELSEFAEMVTEKEYTNLDYARGKEASTSSQSPEERLSDFLKHYPTPEERQRALELTLRWEQGIGPVLTREQVDERYGPVSEGTWLYELPTKCGVPLYPEFQFYKGEVLDGLKEVREQYEPDVFGPWSLSSYLMSPQPELDEETPISPINWLREKRLLRHLLDVVREHSDRLSH